MGLKPITLRLDEEEYERLKQHLSSEETMAIYLVTEQGLGPAELVAQLRAGRERDLVAGRRDRREHGSGRRARIRHRCPCRHRLGQVGREEL